MRPCRPPDLHRGRRLVSRLASAAAELALELFNASGCVNKALFTRVGGMGVSSDIADNELMVNTIDRLGLAGLER